jgi:hypothetical protein
MNLQGEQVADISRLRFVLPVVLAALGLAGCLPEAAIPASQGAPPGNSPGTAANAAPTISGIPPGIVTAGTSYGFQPVVVDADGDPLTFLISGKPEWATFATSTGTLAGMPTASHAGTYGNIVITVSDGEATRTVGPFSITVVTQAPGATGTAILSWAAPAQYTDGTILPTDQLAAYRIYHGSSSGTLDEIAEVDAASATSHTVERLSAGTHYFAITAVTVSGMESAWSEVGAKTIL